MKHSSNYTKILTDETLRETIHHGNEEYPFCYYLEDIWSFDFHCIDWHWHPEVEFVYIQKGTADFLIGTDRLVVNQGTGIFINSQVIHRFESEGNVIIPNIVFMPSLLASESSLIYQKYIQPVLNSALQYQIYTPDILWQNEMLNTLQAIFALRESETTCEIETVQHLLKLWELIYTHICLDESSPAPTGSAHKQAQLQIMMQYIHSHYQSSISLDDIASTVMLSKSSVLKLFNSHLHISPISYLLRYRLKCATRLLLTTENSISSIGQNVGFEDTGYFCRKFKELYEMTPGEYRKLPKPLQHL